MRTALSFGDPVVARGMPGVGLVVELRRSDARVQYLGTQKSAWVDRCDLRRPDAPLPEGSLTAVVSALLRHLDAREMELARLESGRWRLLASHGAVAPQTLDRIRSILGERLRAWVLRPQGMHRIQSVLELEALTDPPAGSASGG